MTRAPHPGAPGEPLPCQPELRERLALLDQIGGQVPGLIYQCRVWPDGRSVFPYASQNAEAILGVGAEALRQDAAQAWARLHPEDKERVEALARNAERTQSPCKAEFRIGDPAQGYRWYAASCQPTLEDDGATLWTGFLWDSHAEHALREELAQVTKEQASLLESLSLGVCFAKGREEVRANASMIELLGPRPGDRRNYDSAKQYVHEEDYLRVGREGHAVMAQGATYKTEVEFRRTDGSTFWGAIAGRAVDPGQPSAGYVWSLEDITARKRAEAELQAQRREIDLYFQTAADLIAVFDIQGRILRVNPSWERVLGYRPEELIGTHALELMHPEDHAAASARVEDIQRLGELRNFSNRYRHRDGSYRCLEWQAVHQAGLNYASARDISDRRAMEAELRRVLAEREALLESANVGIALVVDRVQVWVNQWMVDTFQYRREELEGQSSRMLYPDPEAFAALDREASAVLAAGKVFQTFLQLVRRDGSRLWVHYNGRHLHPGDPAKGVLWVLADVTAQRLAEQALQESECRFRTLFRILPAGVTITDDQGRILETNEAGESLLGYQAQDLLRRSANGSCWEIIRPDGTPMPLEEYARERALKENRRVDVEMGVRRPDGQVTWIQVSAEPIWADGLGLVVVYADVTAQRAAAAAIQREADYLRGLLETASVPFAVNEANGDIPYVNPSFTALFGYRQEDIPTMADWWRLAYPDPEYREQIIDAWRQEMGGLPARTSTPLEARVRCKDGSTLEVLASAGPLLGAEGRTLVTLVDITSRKRAEVALRASETRLAEALQLAQAAHWHYDVATGLFTLNEQFYRIFRTSAKAQGGFSLDPATYAERFLHPEDAGLVALELAKAMATRDPDFHHYLEHRIRYADGLEGILSVRAAIVKAPDGATRFIDGVVQDITERKLAEQELAHRHAQLEELNRSLEARVQETVAGIRRRDQMLTQQSRQAAMGEMIGNIAHQWRQPLSSLSMTLANLRDQWQPGRALPAPVDALLRQGGQLIQGMSRTITDFGNFFRPDKERLEFSLLGQVRAAVTLVEASFRAIGIALKVECAEDVRVLGFPNELAQALLNLLVNARQAYEERGRGEGIVTARVDVHGLSGRVRIQDDAGGVPEELLERIFAPFFTTRASGSGIGLYLTRQIIEDSMGGRISAANRAGGAEFTVLVPTRREHE